MSDRSDWLEWRQQGLGGSDLSAILGLSPYRDATPLAVWLSKVEPLQDDEDTSRPWLASGQRLEAAVCDWYLDEVATPPVGHELRMVEGEPTVGPEPWMRGTPDRIVRVHPIAEPGSVDGWGLEAKTDRNHRSWEQAVPLHVQVQCQWYLLITGLDRWDVAVYLKGRDDWRSYSLDADEQVQTHLYRTARQWWDRHVVGHEAPDLDGSDTAKQWLLRRYPEPRCVHREATADELELVLRYREQRLRHEDLGRARAALEAELKEAIGDAAGLAGDWGQITWGRVSGRRTIDGRRLRRELPEVAEAFAHTSEPSRRLTVAWAEGERR